MSAEHAVVPELIGLENEYEIVAELGRGGSAVVYRARDRSLGRDVAIKVVRGHHARVNDDQLARLAREARMVAQLDHSRIVSVYAVRQLPDGLALIMQWIPGRTLKQRIIEEGPLSVEHALRVLHDVAGALGAAHSRGIVHRDVKPENILLDAHRDAAMLSDFGIAVSADYDTRLTMTGTAIGTPTYMAPELLDGGLPTPRSDVYALGLVAWEMLTGRQPWSGESLYGVIYRQKHDALPSVDEFRVDVPDRVQYVIERALQKRAAARWASGDGLLAQLDGSVLPDDWGAWRSAHARRLAERQLQGNGGDATAKAGGADHSTQATRRFRRDDSESAIVADLAAVPTTERTASVTVGEDTATSDAPDWVLEEEASQHPLDDDRAVTRRVWPWAMTAAILLAIGIAFIGEREWRFARTDAPVLASADTRARELPIVPASPAAPDSLPSAREDSVATTAAPRAASRVAPRATPRASPRAAPRSEPSPPLTETVTAPAGRIRAVGALTLAAGGRHTCFIARQRLVCWGANEDGQLGSGASDVEAGGVRVRGDLAFVSISAGLAHSCGVARGGAVYCWGNGEAGQLGDATTTTRNAPVRVTSSLAFAIVRAGRDHSCALTDTGAVACWGRNNRGQLGDGTLVGRSSPVMVQGSTRYHALTTGASHTCALTVDGTAFCWGANDAGQIGDGSTQGKSQPTAVSLALRFSDIAAGNAHTCAVSLAGDVWCWGRLGSTERSTPSRVAGPSRIQSVTAGAVHSCARNVAGSVWCWGGNEFGQVGNGTTSRYAQPQVVSDRRFDAVVASGAHSCALAGGDVWCWGYNADGQVGVGAADTIPDSASDHGASRESASRLAPSVVTRPMRIRSLVGGGS